jgi:hypothetical protein
MRISRFAIALLAVGPGVVLLGCASPAAPVMQTIRLQTPGCAIASCELSNDRGSWQLPRTPGSVSVAVSREPLKLSCRADDSIAGSATARSSRPATSGAGAVSGGLAGGAITGAALGGAAMAYMPQMTIFAILGAAGIGATAGDAAESRSHPLRYPELVSIPMSCSAAAGGSTATGARGPALGLGIRGMTLDEARAAGLGERTAVMVTYVVAEGRAAASGLLAGDVILALNGQVLGDAADMEERVLAMPQEMPLALSVWRDRRAIQLVLTRASGATP